jgi:cell wall-associated NlpC family hydrolase
MGQISGKTVLMGMAGAVGVVATTQIPAVQGAVGQLHVLEGEETQTGSKEQTVSQTAANSGIRTKAKVVNEKAAKPASVKVTESADQPVADVAGSASAAVVSDAPDTPAESAVIADAASANVKPAATTAVTVQDGDTLSSIAAQFSTTVDAIRAVNSTDLSLLQIGQVVYVPTDSATGSAVVTATAAQQPVKPVTQVNLVTKTSTATVLQNVASVGPVSDVVASSSATMAETSVASDVAEVPATDESVASEEQTAVATDDSTSANDTDATNDASLTTDDATTNDATVDEAPVADTTPSAPAAASQTPAASTPAADANYTNAGSLTAAQRTAVVNYALQLTNENIPYVWGGKTPAGFDCSGLVSYVLANAAGVSIPAYTVSQEAYTTMSTDISSAQPGDLLFWGTKGATWHVAIYIGHNQYVAAPADGYNVRVETISQYFMPDFVGVLN